MSEQQLTQLIEQHERIDWSAVESVSTAEAAAWTQRLIEAQNSIQESEGA